jgi:hypothetical protein
MITLKYLMISCYCHHFLQNLQEKTQKSIAEKSRTRIKDNFYEFNQFNLPIVTHVTFD